MKLVIAGFIILSALCSNAQNRLSFAPGKPRPGDAVKFTYTPPQKIAALKDPIHCVVYKMMANNQDYNYFAGGGKPVEIQLVKKGNTYFAEIATDTCVIGLNFTFTWGNFQFTYVLKTRTIEVFSGYMDSNNNNGFFVPFYTADNKLFPTMNAQIGLILSSTFFNTLGYSNIPLAWNYFKKELETYPESSSSLINLMMNNAAKGQDSMELKKFAVVQLERIFSKKVLTSEDYKAIQKLCKASSMPNLGSYFAQYASKNDVPGGVQVEKLYRQALDEKDLVKKKALTDTAYLAFENMDFYYKLLVAQSANGSSSLLDDYLHETYTQGGDKLYNEALQYVKTQYGYTDHKIPDSYFIDEALEKNNYDLALALNKKYFEKAQEKFTLLKNNPAAYQLSKADEYSTKESIRYYLFSQMMGSVEKDIKIYEQKGDCDAIYTKLQEYKNLIENGEIKNKYLMESLQKSITWMYASNSVKCKSTEESQKELESIARQGAYDQRLVDLLKEVYVKKNGNDNGFNQYLLGLKKTTSPEVIKTVAELIANQKAPDFSLTDMEGKQVKLSSLKGKTVILDFWATWCGPCRASFPAMQQLVDYYKNNPNIVFLFLDTFEDKGGEATLEKMKEEAKKVMTEKNYTFHVLFDVGGTVAKSYGVQGIPAKFVIDKTGTIRYKAVGGGLFSNLVDEMMLMVKNVE